jgi:hypothetical protein
MKDFLKNKIKRFARFSAKRLNEKLERLSLLNKKIILFLFCISFGGISTYIIFKSLVFEKNHVDSLFFQRSPIPSHIGKTDNKIIKPFISIADYKRVELIKTFLDSISINDNKKYMEIMKVRPRLLDSIRLFETFYLQHLKK